jgi:hypothetical protein
MTHVAANLALVHALVVATDGSKIVLGLPGTDYQLHLKLAGGTPAPSGAEVSGMIQARARRVDVVQTGGRYVEPLAGPPRRVQGTIVAADAGAHTLTVACAPGCALVCELTAGQPGADLPVGALVAFELEGPASFLPM